MAGGKAARDKLLARNANHFSDLAKSKKGTSTPKSGLASTDPEQKRWIALRGVVKRGDQLKPELQEEYDRLDKRFGTSGVRSVVRRHSRISETLGQILDD